MRRDEAVEARGDFSGWTNPDLLCSDHNFVFADDNATGDIAIQRRKGVFAMANDMATKNPNNSTVQTKRFRCADVGYTDCAWQFEGVSAEAMLPTIQQHASDVHHLELKEEAIEHVRNAIQDAA